MAFQGSLKELPLPDIIQLVSVSGKTGVFSLTRDGDANGEIFLRGGQIVHAHIGDLQGEDANNDAVLVGADGQRYQAALNPIAGYGNFHDGAIQVAPGDTVTGAVAFQVPDGVAVSTIQWTALSGFGPMVEWTVNG
jgi:hypothetical protein